MADNAGRLFTVIDATLSRDTGDLTVQDIRNQPNTQEGTTPVPALTALIDKYQTLTDPRANAVVGTVAADITRERNDAGESALGNVIADAHLAATREAGAVVAFMNSGGMRDDIRYAASGEEADGELTYGEAFAVHPFGNSMVTMTLTGAQIHALLERQFRSDDPSSNRVLQVSEGFSYTWDAGRPVGSKVDASTITIEGEVVAPEKGYRVTVNSYLADGGSGFSILTEGTDRTGGEIDLDALVAYFAGGNTVEPGQQDRITRLN